MTDVVATNETILVVGGRNGGMTAALEAAECGKDYEGKQKIRHMVEVLIEDLGYEKIGKPVKKPLEGIKIAGYVGCQTNRPFGVDGESFENPKYLDKLVETVEYSISISKHVETAAVLSE
jgi:heterodisulfide reductase subunit B